MAEQSSSTETSGGTADIDVLPLPEGIPIWPWFAPVSGLYEWRLGIIRPVPIPRVPDREPIPEPPFPIPDPVPRPPIPGPGPDPVPTSPLQARFGLSPIPWWFAREELRLDVDRYYPQMAASGTIFSGLKMRVHWIANVAAGGANRWVGDIWHKDGDTSALPHTNVEIQVTRGWLGSQQKATVTFRGGGVADRTRTYAFKSPYFHPVEFEFDTVKSATRVTEINTCDHPNRPASLRCENLSIETVYRRAGFDVRRSGGGGTLPLPPGGTWSDMEMHDAMQVYWSRFANRAQWSLWVLFAAEHEMGHGLGGIMFDDIGPNHRQGTALFSDSFIADPPAGDPDPDAWVRRMRFWTACHEMGHAFNLAHSWQKSYGTPWIPLANEPEARSFMNYPYYVSGGQTAFFGDFEFQFSDPELLFMRHAPERFVQMGNADWFDHHGFEQAAVSPEPMFRLELRVNRERPIFEFLEPVVLEMKLSSTSSEPQLIDENILLNTAKMTVILKKEGKPARRWVPFAGYCFKHETTILTKEQPSLYESLFISAGRNGWNIAEPGVYVVQMVLHLDSEDVVSNLFRLRVAPPRGYDEEYWAQDLFSEDVGRILAFDGSQFLTDGNDTLREVAARFTDRRVTFHARVALGNPLRRPYRLLSLKADRRLMTAACDHGGKFDVTRPKIDEARKELTAALMSKGPEAAETLGHIDYKYYVDLFSEWLGGEGDIAAAAKCQADLRKTLAARGVAAHVLEDIDKRRSTFENKKGAVRGKRKR